MLTLSSAYNRYKRKFRIVSAAAVAAEVAAEPNHPLPCLPIHGLAFAAAARKPQPLSLPPLKQVCSPFSHFAHTSSTPPTHLVQPRPVLRVRRDVLDDGAAEVQQLLLSFAGGNHKPRSARQPAVQHRVGACVYADETRMIWLKKPWLLMMTIMYYEYSNSGRSAYRHA